MITLLTDYGQEGPYVGVCHGVIRAMAPEATVIDVAHTVGAYNVLQGALMLADAVPFLPVGVHVAVVDPGVGGERRAIALRCADGRHYVGPDNGVLIRAAQSSGMVEAVELRRPAPAQAAHGLAVTFDGRDVFAPAAARLAAGAALGELGEPVPHESLQEVLVPAPEPVEDGLRVLIVARDRFGTLQLAGELDALEELLPPGAVAIAGARAEAVAARARTFSDVDSGELLLYVDSFGHLAVAVREGSAAALLGAGPGDWLDIRAATSAAPERS